jgi:hypothetical protein
MSHFSSEAHNSYMHGCEFWMIWHANELLVHVQVHVHGSIKAILLHSESNKLMLICKLVFVMPKLYHFHGG